MYLKQTNGQCIAAQLERFVAALSYVVNECEDDLEKYCGSVRAGLYVVQRKCNPLATSECNVLFRVEQV
jgi:hypothetical protein